MSGETSEDDRLAQQLAATRTMLATHKRRHTQKLAIGEEVAVAELDAITKLETRLATLEQYLRLREMTRARP